MNPQVSYEIVQDENTVSLTILSVMDTDRVVLRQQDNSEEVKLQGKPGDSVTATGLSSFEIIAVQDGSETVIGQITLESDETDLEIMNRTDMDLKYAKQRYVTGETWILELENEIEDSLR